MREKLVLAPPVHIDNAITTITGIVFLHDRCHLRFYRIKKPGCITNHNKDSSSSGKTPTA